MKERPILFSGPMVRAILDGRKTQTRRVVTWHNSTKNTPVTHLWDFSRAIPSGGRYLTVPFAHPEDGWMVDPEEDTYDRVRCIWHVGDVLWVKEAFITGWPIVDGVRDDCDEDGNDLPMKTWYRATDGGISWLDDDDRHVNPPWKSPLFMSRHLSRLSLRITGVRVERVQEISEADAQAEGVERPILCEGPDFGEVGGIPMRGHPMTGEYRDGYRELWDAINGKRGFGWDVNPWVWVVEFERVEVTP